jgi:hypothetical protein
MVDVATVRLVRRVLERGELAGMRPSAASDS